MHSNSLNNINILPDERYSLNKNTSSSPINNVIEEDRFNIKPPYVVKEEEEIKLSPKDKLIQSYADMNNITFDEAKKVIDEGNFGNKS